MRIAIRTACGRDIGFGHLRRCMTLAEELQRRGHETKIWLAGDGSGVALAATTHAAAEPIDSNLQATSARVAATQPSLLIVDDYAVTAQQIAALHRSISVAVIDDLADRELDVDLVLNGNASATALTYRTMPGCVRLLGPRYSLLRSMFQGCPRRQAPLLVGHALVSLGGSDPRGLTARVTRLLSAACPRAELDVVVGPLALASRELTELAATHARVRVHHAPDHLLSLMMRADIAVSAGGQTNYELAAVGVPAVSICVADNQRGNIEALAAIPTLIALFDDGDRTMSAALEHLAASQDLRQKMSENGQRLVDGLGAARVAEAIEALIRKKSDV